MVATLMMLLVVSAVTVTTAVAGDSGLNADFTFEVNGMTVSFTDASGPEGNVTSWTWDFGDPLGDQSNQQNPSYTYPSPGTYNVALTVMDNNGGYDYITKSVTVEADTPVSNPPVAQFSANPTTGEIPLKVKFTDDSIRNPTTWEWDFGDGSTSDQQSPEHTYNSAGTFTVTLTATNDDGSDTETGTIEAKNTVNALPVAAIGYDKTEGDAPLTVQFQDLSSKGETRTWNFGDGATSTDKDPTHTFADPGTYTVKLTSTNSYGSDEATCSIKANGQSNPDPDPVEPKAFFTKDMSSGDAPLDVTFTDGSTYTSLANATFAWDFGDGATSDEQNPTHTFTEPGTYTVILTITDKGYDGYIPQYSEEVKVTDPTPVEKLPVDFSASPESGKAPLTVEFTDLNNYDPENYGFDWDFGDTFDSIDQNPIHEFTDPGTYTVTFYVSGPGGVRGDKSKTITVLEADPDPQPDPVKPEAAFVMNRSSGIAPLDIQFTDKSENASSVKWDFGDGSTSDEKNPLHTFAVGDYIVKLTATNDNGTDTQTADVSAIKPEDPKPDPVLPVAGFETNTTTGYAPLTVKFDDKSSNADTYEWRFGDGGTSSDKSPVHTYTSIGTYTANLTVGNINGTDSREVTIKVTEKPAPEPDPVTPKAFYTANVTSGDAPLAVQFTDKSDFTSLENVTWNWSFDGTNSSTERNPVYTFTEPGTYTVILTITDKGYDGYIPQYSEEVKVTDPTPVEKLPVDFSVSPESGKAPLTVEFRSLIDYDSEDVGYTWYFGDEIGSFEPNPTYEFAKAGTYDVTLVVSADGKSGEKTKMITVQEADPEPDEDPVLPVAGFTPNTTSGNAPLTVKFDDDSKNTDKWSWDFGDGGSSSEPSPIHTYMEAGDYIANLTVSNANGTDSKQVHIGVTDMPAPVANFTCNAIEGKAPFTVIFADFSENAISWKWDFGDKISSTDKSPSHVFSTAGTYKVTLTVSNGFVQDSESVTITVEEPDVPTLSDPIADFTASAKEGNAPLTVQFTDKSKNAYSRIWDFGDGKTSDEKNPVHVFECKGQFTVKLTVKNPNGEDSKTMCICIKSGSNGGGSGGIIPGPVPAAKPVADFKADPTCGTAPLCVKFTDLSSKDVKERKWDFGDGATSKEISPSHIYKCPGTYKATLKVKNDNGESCKALTIKVLAKDCVIPVPEKPVCPDDKVKPDSKVTPKNDDKKDEKKDKDAEGKSFIPGVIDWNLEDGIISILPASSHHKGSKGFQKITPGQNVAAFKYLADGLCFQFTDCSSGMPVEWYWDFGDGSTSTEKNPRHVYAKSGAYTVKLTVKYSVTGLGKIAAK